MVNKTTLVRNFNDKDNEYLFFFIILQTKNRKIGIKMKLRYYQIAIRYKNKMHDFHGWGVAAQI